MEERLLTGVLDPNPRLDLDPNLQTCREVILDRPGQQKAPIKQLVWKEAEENSRFGLRQAQEGKQDVVMAHSPLSSQRDLFDVYFMTDHNTSQVVSSRFNS